MGIPDRWMTVVEVADYLQISRAKIYAMAQINEIPCTKVAGQWRFKRDQIDRWMHAQGSLSNQAVSKQEKTDKRSGGTR